MLWQLNTELQSNHQQASEIKNLNAKLADKTNQEGFERQKQCAAQAEHLFHQWGYKDDGLGTSYQSNWSIVLRKCFITLTSGTADKDRLSIHKFLLDAFSLRQYAEFYGFADAKSGFRYKPYECELIPLDEIQICKTEKEYDTFVLSYMDK